MARGFSPLLLAGGDLKGAGRDAALVNLLSRAIVQQYSSPFAEPYLQGERGNKVLLIDDFEEAKLSLDAQRRVLRLCQDRFGTVVVFASDIIRVQDMTQTSETDPFAGFERCSMKAFGRFHRQKLIRAWLTLGREDDQGVQEGIDKRVARTDKTISTLMGKNVLPHFPVTILTLLQMMENKETTITASGAYGYLYEALLKLALAGVNPKDVDEKITYISGIGYAMFAARHPVPTEEDLRREHEAYCERYDMVRDFSKMVADLLNAEILVEYNGSFRFKYPYIFYYSVAKYFQDHASGLRRELYELADHIYGETNANVLIFYVYLTKDQDLIEHIVTEAARIYNNYKGCDMQGDVEFLNRLSATKPPPLELECGNTSSHQDDYNRRRDAAGESALDRATEDYEVRYDDELQEIIKITIAFKTLQILGQILRNFTGSLEGPLKLSITKECYALGMRTLYAILSIATSDIDRMRQYIGGLITERSGITDKQELATKTDDAISWLGTVAAFGAVKRVSYAVGHSDLTNTYRKIIEENNELSVQIIDAAIKLDHFERIPERELGKLEARVAKNDFADSVIRDLVADFLYFYSIDFPTMQKLGAQWGISVSTPKYLANRAKK